MRVGILDYTNDGLRSGVEHYTLGLIHCLANHTMSDELIVYTNDPDTVSQIHPRIVVCRIPGRRLLRKAVRLWWQHFCLPRQAEADGLDVLHCPAYVMPLRRCRVPCVITVHDVHALAHPQWCSWGNRLHYGVAMSRSIRRAAGVIVVSDNTREATLRHFGPLRDDIRVIPPGIDDIFTDAPDPSAQDECRRRHRLPDRYILQVGNVEPRKNAAAAIEGVRLLRQRGLPHALVLAGKITRAPATLIRMLSDAQRDGVVHHLGYVPRADLPSIYRMADAVLCAAHHEGFGFPALEALACGTPVVSSMAGAMAETLGNAAMVADPNSAQSIAEAIIAIVSDSAMCDRMRQAGLKQAADFRWENFAGDVRQTYVIACQNRNNPATIAADR